MRIRINKGHKNLRGRSCHVTHDSVIKDTLFLLWSLLEPNDELRIATGGST